MNSQLSRIVSRVVVGVLIALILAVVRKASAAALPLNITSVGTSGVNHEFTGYTLRIMNPTGAAQTLYSQSNGNPLYFPLVNAAYPYVQLLATGGPWTLPAGGQVDIPITVKIYKNNSTTGAWSTVGERAYQSFSIRNAAFTVYQIPIGIDVTMSSTAGSWSASPSTGQIGSFYFSNPAPFAKITVNADANAVGSRYWRTKTAAGVEGSLSALTLALGANLVVNTTTPATWTAGSWYQVVQMVGSTPTVIGETAIIKDGQGNFDLSIAATGLPMSGVVTVTGQLGLSGLGQIMTAGGLTPYAFTFDGTATTRATQTWTPASQIAEGAAVTVQYRETASDEWQTVGSGTINKAPDGSFAESITAAGEGDPEAPPVDAATFILDIVSFESSSKVVQLEIDGQTFTPSGSGVGGDPINGLKQTLQISLPGDPAQYARKPYRWKVSGSLGGLAVNGMTLTDGVAPQIYFSDFESGFVASNQATIGEPVNDPGDVPDNPFDPEAPPVDAAAQAMQDNYRSTRKAVEDAMNPGAPKPYGDGPSDGEGKLVAGQLRSAGEGLGNQIDGLKNGVGGFTAGGSVGTSPTLSFVLAPMGTVTIDASRFDPWPGVIRVVLLAWLAWSTMVGGTKIFRSAFAG